MSQFDMTALGLYSWICISPQVGWGHEHLYPQSTTSDWRLALSTTVHWLASCGLGDLVGMTLATGLGLSNLGTNLLAIALGVLGGFVMGILPWLRMHHGMA